jgi:hypothetical protein
MPGRPGEQKDEKLPTRDGELTVKVSTVTLISPEVQFRFGYRECPAAMEDVLDVYQEGRKDKLKGDLSVPRPEGQKDEKPQTQAGELAFKVSTVSLLLEDHPGWDIRMEVSRKVESGISHTWIYRAHLYLVGRRLYELGVFYDGHGAVAHMQYDVNKYLNSLELTAPSKQPQAAADSGLGINPGAWKVISPQGSDCSVLMPGTPQSSTTRVGEVLVHNSIVSLEAPEAHFQLQYGDVGEVAAEDKETMLEMSGRALVNSWNGQLLSAKAIRRQEAPGREIRFEFSHRQGGPVRHGHARLYLVGSRLYQLIVILPKEKANAPEADTFFVSFTLTQAGSR